MARQTAAQRLADKTTLDEDTTKPSTTAPGDGPADTTDPDERAVSAPAGGLDESAVKAGTRNTVKPAGKREAPEAGADRFEEYNARTPEGDVVRIRRNITTGKRELVEVDAD